MITHRIHLPLSSARQREIAGMIERRIDMLGEQLTAACRREDVVACIWINDELETARDSLERLEAMSCGS